MTPTQDLAMSKLTRYVEEGQRSAPAALERIEQMRPIDTIVPMTALHFSDTLEAVLGQTVRPMHENAIRQAVARTPLGQKYASSLRVGSERALRLLAHNLNELYAMSDPTDRVLLRAVQNELRAVLTDNFRRYDFHPILDTFVETVATMQGVITEVQVSDLRIGVKAILPQIMWIGNDPVVLGARLGSSDFGKGTLEEALFIFRLLCGNGMVGERMVRQIHLGKRISDDTVFSERTRELDTQTMASAVGDITRSQFSAEAFNARRERIDTAQKTDIDPKSTFKELGKLLTRGELEQATEVFAFGTEEQVPAGRNAWRLSNTMSWIAKSATNIERTMELERLAGALLETPTAKASVLSAILDEYDEAAA